MQKKLAPPTVALSSKLLLDRSTNYLHALNRGVAASPPEIKIIEAFDLLEFQKRARETCCPKKLFELWEDVCRRYDHHLINRYEFDEMKEDNLAQSSRSGFIEAFY